MEPLQNSLSEGPEKLFKWLFKMEEGIPHYAFIAEAIYKAMSNE
jgi:hypothetical protein